MKTLASFATRYQTLLGMLGGAVVWVGVELWNGGRTSQRFETMSGDIEQHGADIRGLSARVERFSEEQASTNGKLESTNGKLDLLIRLQLQDRPRSANLTAEH